MYFPKISPLIKTVGMPIKKPTNITQPISAPRMPATAIGPGVGGINAWPNARPDSSGIAYSNKDLPVFFCMA